MYNFLLLLSQSSSLSRLIHPYDHNHTFMMTEFQLLPLMQHLPPQHSCSRLAFRSISMAPSVKVPRIPPHQRRAHSRSTWRISAPSPLSAQLPIVCPPSSFVERLVLRPRGTCCSCPKAWLAIASLLAQGPNCPIQRAGRGLEHT
jgi:hypothetical protein